MKIIVAVDESQHADFVAGFLTRLPLPPPNELVLVHVVEDLHGYAYGTRVRTLLAEAVQSKHETAGKNLLRRMHDHFEPAFKEVRQELLHGHAADRITAIAEREHADLIVLGARGVNAMERFLLGSTSERVVAYAGCSVLVGHRPQTAAAEDTSSRNADVATPLRILVACDGSAQAQTGIDQVARMALAESALVELVTVQTLVTSFHMDVVQHLTAEWHDERKHAENELGQAAERLRSVGVRNVQTRVVEGGNVADELLKAADRLRADLIVIGASGKNAVDRFLLGSVSKRIVRHAPCSVWVARDSQAGL